MRNSQVLTCTFFEINSEPWHHTRQPKTHHELDNVQLPDAAKHSFSLKVAGHIIAVDMGFFARILVDKRNHGS
jgi:hypothetical protein